jgi:hypothetical protein
VARAVERAPAGKKCAAPLKRADDPVAAATDRDCRQEWPDLLHGARARFAAGRDAIAAADKRVRICWRECMVEAALQRGELKLANDILDSIAKESGDAFGNKQKHEHSGPNGEASRIEDARERVFKRLDDLRQRVESRTLGLAAARGEKRAAE